MSEKPDIGPLMVTDAGAAELLGTKTLDMADRLVRAQQFMGEIEGYARWSFVLDSVTFDVAMRVKPDEEKQG